MRRLRSMNALRYVRIEFKPVYIAKGNFGSQWVNENQSKLDFVTDNLTELVNVLLLKRSHNYESYCHFLRIETEDTK